LNLLLDTHIWIWSVDDPSRLTERVAFELLNPDNELWLSPVSTWEAILLVEKKRIQLLPDAEQWMSQSLRILRLREACMTHAVAVEAARVVLPHRDPGDRLLAATAIVYGLTLVTADQRLLGCHGLPLLPNR